MLSEAQIIPTVPASDLDRARHFYEDKLGLRPKADVGQLPDGVVYAVGEGGLLVYRTDAPHGESTAAGFLVDDILREMTELRERGITFEDLDLPGLKTENGVAEFSGQKGAWFKDSEGNYLALTQM
ncbi:MAG: VOC family protein [Thermoleophilia bacterium]|nr:VOC family protein [Thermoleophilia bacterium]